MKEEKIKVNNFIEALELLHLKNDEYDVLIDFHDRKKWILPNKITVHLIPPEKSNRLFEWRDGITHYIRNSKDNSIEYICNIRGRYEYYVKGWLKEYGLITRLGERAYTREFLIGMHNQHHDVLVDNGKNKEDYECPYISPCTPYGTVEYPDDYEFYNEPGSTSDYIIEERKDGGINIYDKDAGKLKCICNIGKRYEYYFMGKYEPNLSDYKVFAKHDVIVQLIPDKKRVYVILFIRIEPDKNPYIVRKRDDGGVDLLSKKDGALKYICNTGKRFYYRPYTEGRLYH